MIIKPYETLKDIVEKELGPRGFQFSSVLENEQEIAAKYFGTSILRKYEIEDKALEIRAIKIIDHWLFKADERFYANRVHFALSPVQKIQIPFPFNFNTEKKFIDGEHEGQTLYVTAMEEGILKPREEIVIKYFRCRQEPFAAFIIAKNLIYNYGKKEYELFAEGFDKYGIEAFGLSKVKKLILI